MYDIPRLSSEYLLKKKSDIPWIFDQTALFSTSVANYPNTTNVTDSVSTAYTILSVTGFIRDECRDKVLVLPSRPQTLF